MRSASLPGSNHPPARRQTRSIPGSAPANSAGRLRRSKPVGETSRALRARTTLSNKPPRYGRGRLPYRGQPSFFGRHVLRRRRLRICATPGSLPRPRVGFPGFGPVLNHSPGRRGRLGVPGDQRVDRQPHRGRRPRRTSPGANPGGHRRRASTGPSRCPHRTRIRQSASAPGRAPLPDPRPDAPPFHPPRGRRRPTRISSSATLVGIARVPRPSPSTPPRFRPAPGFAKARAKRPRLAPAPWRLRTRLPDRAARPPWRR